jgi:hypothetical protein
VTRAVLATRWLAAHGTSVREASHRYGTWPNTILRHWRRLYPDRRTPYSTETDAIRDDYGSVGERRLWRALTWLVANGKAVRVGPSGKSEGYVLP